MHQTVATWSTSIAVPTAPDIDPAQSGVTYSMPRATPGPRPARVAGILGRVEPPASAKLSWMRALIRPLVQSLHPYVPGEQPKTRGLIKLNTNENPYPPSPRVLEAIRAAVDGRLRLYPNPTSQRLRERLARLHKCDPANVFVGNG